MPELTPVDYVRAGWALCSIPRGAKGPRAPRWNHRDRAITTEERAKPLDGVGLCHAYSGTCCLDVDDLAAARAWLAERGVDFTALYDAPDAVRIVSGRPNRAKLLFRLPPEVEPLPTIKVADGALEFRCATRSGRTVQDVLPPSVHPGTGQPYRWEYGNDAIGDWRAPPTLPPNVLALWRSLLAPSRDNDAPPAPEGAQADEIRAILAHHDPDAPYDEWIQVGMALHHETEGSDEGLALWDEWSARGEKYAGRADLEYHWRSFGRSDTPVTLARLRAGRVASPDEFDDLTAENVDVDLIAAIDAEKAERFRFLSRAEAKALPRPTYLIDELVPHVDVGAIYGQPGSGKTFVAIDLTYAVALGRPWRDKMTKQGGVLYVAAEDDAGVRMRMDAYEQAHGITGDAPILTLCDAPNVMQEETRRALRIAVRDAAARVNAAMIVIDTLASVTAGADENSAKDMTVLLDYCKQLHRDTGAVVVLVHHEGKTEGRGPRGSSALHGAFGFELFVEESEGGGRTITVAKLKNGPSGAVYGFRLAPVTLDMFGQEPVTSCVVEHCDAPAELGKRRRRLGATERTTLDVIRDLVGLTDGAVSVRDVLDAASAKLPHDEGKRDQRRTRIRRALESLQSGGLIEITDDQVGLNA